MIVTLAACHGPPDTDGWTARDAAEPWGTVDTEPIPVPDALASLDWLADPSAWRWGGLPDTRAERGTLGVGNGIVFGIVGLDGPNTLSNSIGPGYDADAGFFPDAGIELWQDGAALPVTDARAERPRRSAVARTLVASGGLELLTTDVAPLELPVILRHVTVRNGGAEAASGLSLVGTEGALLDGLETRRGARSVRISCDAVDVPTLEAGAEWSTTCRHVFSGDDLAVDAADALAESYAATSVFLDGAMALSTPDPKVDDLYEGMLVTEWVQTTPSGLVSPMHRYTRAWLRDSEGPVRLYLRAGLFEAADALLEATFLASVSAGAISNSFASDVDLEVALPDDPEAFWAAAPFMAGRNPVEAPSYPVLLHAQLADWAGWTPDSQRAAWLDACLARQELGDEGLFPFSGDETWRFPLAAALGGLPEELGWSAASAMLYDAAAATLGRDGVGTDAWWVGDYWAPVATFGDLSPTDAPFEDVALQPIWWGTGPPSDREVANLATTVDVLLRDDGTLLSRRAGSTEDSPMFTGMVPGFFLQNVARTHRPEEAAAFAALDRVASVSGHFEELHGADDRPLDLTHSADGLGSDVPARFRPWEGGDTVSGMLDYLLGVQPAASTSRLSLSPHLGPGWPSLEAAGLRLGEVRYDLLLEGYAEGQVLTLQREVSTPWTLTLTLHGDHPFARVWLDGAGLDPTGEIVTLEVPWTTKKLVLVGEYADSGG